MPAIRFSPDGKILATGGFDKVIKLWDAGSFQLITTLQGNREAVFAAAFSSDGKILATVGGTDFSMGPWMRQGEICLWDVAGKKLLTRFAAHHGRVYNAAFTLDNQTLITHGRDGKVHLWDVAGLLKWSPKP